MKGFYMKKYPIAPNPKVTRIIHSVPKNAGSTNGSNGSVSFGRSAAVVCEYILDLLHLKRKQNVGRGCVRAFRSHSPPLLPSSPLDVVRDVGVDVDLLHGGVAMGGREYNVGRDETSPAHVPRTGPIEIPLVQ